METALKKMTSKRIGRILLERKIIDDKKLNEALSIQKERKELLGDIFINLGYATEQDITEALTTQFGFPYLPLANYNMDSQVVRLIPEGIASRHCIIAVDKIEDSLSVAISNPLNVNTIKEDIMPITACDVQLFMSTPSDIRKCIQQYYGLAREG